MNPSDTSPQNPLADQGMTSDIEQGEYTPVNLKKGNGWLWFLILILLLSLLGCVFLYHTQKNKTVVTRTHTEFRIGDGAHLLVGSVVEPQEVENISYEVPEILVPEPEIVVLEEVIPEEIVVVQEPEPIVEVVVEDAFDAFIQDIVEPQPILEVIEEEIPTLPSTGSNLFGFIKNLFIH